ncbi:MAG: class I SAM-dependent methyltransferase [Alphaproteobacteria bacterium]|jgi:hypothetical protein|nr:class I SAM-dependent methyltransferase [Alphaproteobacteria bacterium]|tara:strand:- start:660 stop:1490 length:831 start_codon:yes stop_codon:yes gene_type:complete
MSNDNRRSDLSEEKISIAGDFPTLQELSDYEELGDCLLRIRDLYTNRAMPWNLSHYIGDGLVALGRNMGFSKDLKLVNAIEENAEKEDGYTIARRIWRFHTLAWAAKQALKTDGDFVELGVFLGFSAKFLCDYVDFHNQDRKFFLFDTFKGTPQDMRNKVFVLEDEYVDNALSIVEARFVDYPNVQIVEGIIPDSITDDEPQKIAFIHVDLVSAKAEIAGLERLFDRVTPGGVIVFQAYGISLFREQHDAINEWFSARQIPILESPTGQGVVIKPW